MDVGNRTEYQVAACIVSWASLCISGCGLILNLVIIFIFLQPSMRSTSINVLLAMMGGADSSNLVFGGLAFIFPELYETSLSPWFTRHLHLKHHLECWLSPLAMTAQTASCYMLIITSIERFTVVCRPLKSKSLCSVRNAIRASVLVLIFSFLYNSPRFFERRVQKSTSCGYNCEPHKMKEMERILNIILAKKNQSEHLGESIGSNNSGEEGFINLRHLSALVQRGPQKSYTSTKIVLTRLGKNTSYRSVYHMWMYPFFLFAIPFSVLVILNCFIIRSLRRAFKFRRNCTQSQRSERLTALMLIIITLIFLLSHSPSWIWRLAGESMGERLRREDGTLNLFHSICNLLVVLSSSSNFLIYTAFCRRFRQCLQSKTSRSSPRSFFQSVSRDESNRPQSSYSSVPLRTLYRKGCKPSTAQSWLLGSQISKDGSLVSIRHYRY